MARPRFYAVDDLGTQETETRDDGNSSFQASKFNKDQTICHQRDRQLHPEAKDSVQFKNVTIVKTYPTDKSAMTEKLEDMRRLLTTIRRRVSVQHPGNSPNAV